MNRRELWWPLAALLGGVATMVRRTNARWAAKVPHMGVLCWDALGDEAQFGLTAAPARDAMVRDRAQAVIVQPLFATSQGGPLVDLLARRKLPAMTAQGACAASGGLLAYGLSRADLSHRTASFVDRILKGAASASLPVEAPTSYERVINLCAAKAMGIAVPQSLLLRANRVIA